MMMIVLIISLVGTWSSSLNFQLQLILTIIVIVLILTLVIVFRKTSFQCSFYDNHLLVKYNYLNKQFKIDYFDLLEIRYYAIHKGQSTNRIYFNSDKKKNYFKINSVKNGDEFIQFVKWIKSKNEKIEINIMPSDNLLNHKIQEEYGFKYREGYHE